MPLGITELELVTNPGPGGIAWVRPATSSPPAITPASVPVFTGLDPNEIAQATHGKPIPISALGLARIGTAGIIFGPKINNNTASFGVSFGFAADPTGTRRIEEIALDSKVAWTLADGFVSEEFTFRFYQGTYTQAADPLEIADYGDEAVAYRPQMVLFFEDLPLAQFNNKVPFVAAVIGDTTDSATPADGINMGEALERFAYSPWVGFEESEFDTNGITDIVQGMIVAENVSFLDLVRSHNRVYRSWDILQTDKLRIVDRGSNVTPDITLDLTRIVATDSAVTFTRQEQNSIPRELELITIDPDVDYTLSPSKAQLHRDPVPVTSSVGKETVTLPIIIDATTRMALVTFAKYQEEQARKKVEFEATAYGLEIEPGDLVRLEDIADGIDDEVFKITETLHTGNYTVQCVGEAILRCALPTAGTAEHVRCYNDAFSANDTATFADADFGAPDANRWIVVAFNLHWFGIGGSETLASVTIGGVTATAAATATATGTVLISAVYYAQVPDGTTGDVVIVADHDFQEVSLHVYRAVSPSFALHDSDDNTSSASGSFSLAASLDITANGIAVAAASTHLGATFTWSGLTSDCSFAQDGDTTGQRASASHQPGDLQSAYAVQLNLSAQFDHVTLAVASFVL